MAVFGPGIFFDGKTSARHEVTVELDSAGLRVRGPLAGETLARWLYGEFEQVVAPEGLLRLARVGSPASARLEIRDPALASAIGEVLARGRRIVEPEFGQAKLVGLSLAALLSLVLGGIFGVPAMADRLAPRLPGWVEQRLGNAVDAKLRSMLDVEGSGRRFECGGADAEKAGRDELDSLVRRLAIAAELPVALHAAVLRRADANALAVPGGRIYLFEGLIDKSGAPDELAAVIAHEIGHIAHHDGTKSLLRTAGMSFLFGVLLGDFGGGGAMVIAARAVLQSAYSREVEAEADRYGVDLMNKIGGDARALGVILARISGAIEPATKLLSDHPDTAERVASINAAVATASNRPVLDLAAWSRLKRICAG